MQRKSIDDLVGTWGGMSPASWAQHEYGWIMEDGKSISLYPWQRAVLDVWYQHRETVSTLAISCIKKSGKTSLNAILLAWRWLTLPGEHFACANDMDQAAGRQFSMISEMIRRHPILAKHVKISTSRLTFIPTGSTLIALAVDAAGNAGANHSTASHTEAWGVRHESGVRSWEELTPPPGRRNGFPALRVADSYAGWQGESAVWHQLVDRGLAGERVDSDWPIFLDAGLMLFHADGDAAQSLCFPGTESERKTYYEEQRRTLRPGT